MHRFADHPAEALCTLVELQCVCGVCRGVGRQPRVTSGDVQVGVTLQRRLKSAVVSIRGDSWRFSDVLERLSVV